ncbi:ATP-binding protein [Alteromonas macleodii]|jgi:hypothetical protein|nr:ATP-binding protein [Alteromonas macleodii]MDW5286702.1 ATP-binding protein [Alteromonas macleodii]|tara:strand:- start:968 stop:2821 length:1854 start_codon:yes stop_codon:yes gene_type:complete
MMEIDTSSAVKLFFPNPSLMLVYFEAIANAFDAGAKNIEINIGLTGFDKPDSLEVTITDDGAGFNDENFERFSTLLKPRDKHHKGIGRLVFLNYFKRVKVLSIWEGNKREFIFKDEFDKSSVETKAPELTQNSTTLIFEIFRKDKIKSYDDLKPDILKRRIIEHFLPALDSLAQKVPDFRISLVLCVNEENRQREFFSRDVSIVKNDLPPLTLVEIEDPKIDAFSKVKIRYHITENEGSGSCLTAFNIDDRTVPVSLVNTSSIPYGYSCIFLFESEIFHSNTDSSRQKLILPEGLSESVLFKTLKSEIAKILSDNIPEIKIRNKEVKSKFEQQFPHLLGFFEEDTVGLIDKDEALSSAQQKFFTAEKEVLECSELSDDAYNKSLELSSRVLTEYVLYREKIIRKMKSMTDKNSEKDIHNLIVPRFKKFSGDLESELYQNNAWLLDDKFMVFQTILSEKRMDQVIKAIKLDEEDISDDGRPDIAMIFSSDPDTTSAVDVVVVEIKKKTSDEKENSYAINQLLQRAEKLVKHCSNIQRIWYYAVLEVNDSLATRLRQQKWAPLFSKGKVFYQEFETPDADNRYIPTPTFVMSFDAIVSDAETRNHTFLEILKEGMRKYA